MILKLNRAAVVLIILTGVVGLLGIPQVVDVELKAQLTDGLQLVLLALPILGIFYLRRKR